MRVVDQNGKELKKSEVDRHKGRLHDHYILRPGIPEVDFKTKHKYEDDDFEHVLVYIPTPDADPNVPLSNEEKLRLVAESITEEPYPKHPPKDGHIYQRMYSAKSGSIVWTLVPDPLLDQTD